ncbi:MAG: hypothetical protein ACXACY_28080 [Candidatus Hodarchaeales archaeon]|jgi:hypothetical protein
MGAAHPVLGLKEGGVLKMWISKWFKSKNKKHEEINIENLIEEVEEKRKKIKNKTNNPHNQQYLLKLKELLYSKADSRDRFINWITGLTTGSILLIFSNISSAEDNIKNYLIFSGIILFSTIVSMILFKILSEVRYRSLELEINLLKNLWEGHDIRSELEEKLKGGMAVEDEDKLKFLQNQLDSLKFLDDNYLEKLKKPINIESSLCTTFYWLTIVLFFIGIIFMAIYFLLV